MSLILQQPTRETTATQKRRNNCRERRCAEELGATLKFSNQPSSANQQAMRHHVQRVVTAIYTVHRVSNHETLQRFFSLKRRVLHARAKEHTGMNGWTDARKLRLRNAAPRLQFFLFLALQRKWHLLTCT